MYQNIQDEIFKEERHQKAIAKNGIIYILLAWVLGVSGIHNFYVYRPWKGGIQLFLSLTSWILMFIPLLVVAIWVLGEILFVNKDGRGIPFSGNRLFINGLRFFA